MKRRDDIDDSQNDNVIFVDAPEEAAESNAKIQKEIKNKRIFKGIIVIAVLAFVIVWIYGTVNKEYKGYKVVESNNTNYENTANYVKFSGNLLKYTADGVSYINSNGATVWSAGINMSAPIVEVSGDYAVIADLGGNIVSVFNVEGQVSSVTMPYVICDVDIGSQGAFAVVLESDETNYINMYNKKGEIIYEIQTTINKSGYPLDITISDDSQKLFTSYINVGASSVDNNLAAYNFGDVGQNTNADRMVGGYKIEDEIISKVEFINNNTVVAFGTKTITVYSMKEKPTEKGRVVLNKEIRSIFYNKDYFGFVEENDSADSEHLYKLRVFNTKGNEMFNKDIDFKYNNINATEKEIIVTGDNNCLIVRTNGTIKYNGLLSNNIKNMVQNSKNEYIVVYDNITEKIKLKTGKVLEDNTSNNSDTEEEDFTEAPSESKSKLGKPSTTEEITTSEDTTATEPISTEVQSTEATEATETTEAGIVTETEEQSE